MARAVPDPAPRDRTTADGSTTVAAYARTIDGALRGVAPAVVEGEVQRPKRGNRGVWWFDLTDGDAVLSCSYLPWLGRGRGRGAEPDLRHGDRVRVHARGAELWVAGGRLRVLVAAVEPAGEGEMLRRRAELVERLRAEGLCDPATFPPLPRFPRTVGLVAGRDSDAMADVLHALDERYPIARVVTAPCRVQGVAAAREVVDRLARLDRLPDVDVVVVARGGGSVQDLLPFDDEGLCRAIRAIGVPVVTAIGHTENDPVCNQVTHAAYVPRHAAERVVPDVRELVGDLDRARDARRRSVAGRFGPAARREALDARASAALVRGRIDRQRTRVAGEGRTVAREADVLLRSLRGEIDDRHRVLAAVPARIARTTGPVRHALDATTVAAATAVGVRAARRRLDEAGRTLELADPRRRGWTLVTGPDGSPVRSTDDLAPGDRIALVLADGTASARVDGVGRDEPAAALHEPGDRREDAAAARSPAGPRRPGGGPTGRGPGEPPDGRASHDAPRPNQDDA